jgi:hypothetical protein
MRASPLPKRDEDFIAEIDKDETSCTVDDIVIQLKQRIHGDERLNFLMVCEPSPEMIVDGECTQEGAGERKFCVGIVFADSTLPTGQGRSVHVADLGDRFALSFMEATSQHPPGNVKSMMQRLFA